MILGIVKRILKDDLTKAGALPAWIDALLTPINDFIEKVGLALQNRLTFTDNFLCKIVTQTFTSGSELQVNPQIASGAAASKPTGVLLINSGGQVVTQFGWNIKSSGNIGVTATFLNGGTAQCTILILFG